MDPNLHTTINYEQLIKEQASQVNYIYTNPKELKFIKDSCKSKNQKLNAKKLVKRK